MWMLMQAISQIRYFAGMADKIMGRITPTAGGMQAFVYKEPLGTTILDAQSTGSQ